jgi:hypothetical protein
MPQIIFYGPFSEHKNELSIIANIRQREPTKAAFQGLQILRLPDIYTFSVLLFVYKYKNWLLPSTFNCFYTTNSQVHKYPTQNAAQLRVPATKTKMATSFIKRTGVNIWNSFSNIISPQNMKIGAFKRATITKLISNYNPAQA